MLMTTSAGVAIDKRTTERGGKTARVAIRVTEDVKFILERAASLSGRSLSDFISNSAVSAAQKVIEEMNRLHLTEKDSVAFLDALTTSPEPNNALKAAAARHKKIFG